MPSFGEGTYDVFFCLDSRTFQQAKFYHNDLVLNQITYTNVTHSFSSNIGQQNPAGVLLAFSPTSDGVLNVRMGVSWTSIEKACAFAEAEIPNLDAFEDVKAAARFVCCIFFTSLLSLLNVYASGPLGTAFSGPLKWMLLVSAMISSSSSGRPFTAPTSRLRILQVTILSGYPLSPTGTVSIASGTHLIK